MTSIDRFPIFLPEDEEMFEEMTKALLQEVYGVSLELYGRRGQGQHGVDIIGRIPLVENWNSEIVALQLSEEDVEKRLGIQCKVRTGPNSRLSFNDIKREHDKAQTARLEVAAFIMATSMPRNGRLQDQLDERRNELPLLRRVFYEQDLKFLLTRHRQIYVDFCPYLSEDIIRRTLLYRDLKRLLLEARAENERLKGKHTMETIESRTLPEEAALGPKQRQMHRKLLKLEKSSGTRYRDLRSAELLTLTRKLTEEGDVEGSTQAILTVLLRRENQPDLLQVLAIQFRKVERYDNALWAIDQAIQYAPSDAQVWLTKCSILLVSRQLQEALKTASEAIETVGTREDLLSARGTIYMQMARFDDAGQDFEQAYSLAEQPSRDIVIGYVMHLVRLERFDEAENLLRRQLQEDLIFDTGKVLLGVVLESKGAHKEAIRVFAEMEYVLEDSGFRGYYGYALKAAGRLREGLPHIKQSLEWNISSDFTSDDVKAACYSELGSLHTQIGDFDNAEMYFEKAKRIRQDFFGLWLGIGILHYRKREIKQADKALKNALVYAPSNSTLNAWTARVKISLGHFQQAMQFYDNAIELAPGSGEEIRRAASLDLYLCAGRKLRDYHTKHRSDDLRLAEDLALKSYQYFRNVGALEFLIQVAVAKGNKEEAVRYCLDALDMEPGLETRLHIAACLVYLGEPQRALEVCKNARMIDESRSRNVCQAILMVNQEQPIGITTLLRNLVENDSDLVVAYRWLARFSIDRSRATPVEELNRDIQVIQELFYSPSVSQEARGLLAEVTNVLLETIRTRRT